MTKRDLERGNSPFFSWKKVSTCLIGVTYRVNILTMQHLLRTIRCIVTSTRNYIRVTEPMQVSGGMGPSGSERRKFLDSSPFCVKCYEEGHLAKATVVDHIKPHCGDQKFFWGRRNWQPLCERHHNVKSMTEDGYVEYKL